MVITNKLKQLVKEFEGCKLKAYKCPAGIWTIGYGNTRYEDGLGIREGDEITIAKAEMLLEFILIKFIKEVEKMVKSNINQNQKDAITDFAYNCGIGNLNSSTLLKKVNANPNDPTIKDEFLKWNKAKGKVLNGLTKRRQAEANLYFS
jgi:lysozyme